MHRPPFYSKRSKKHPFIFMYSTINPKTSTCYKPIIKRYLENEFSQAALHSNRILDLSTSKVGKRSCPAMSTSEEDRKGAVIAEIEKFLRMAVEQPVIELLTTALKKFRSEPVELAQPPPEVTYKIANRAKYEQWIDLPQTVELTLLFDKMKEGDVHVDFTETSLDVKVQNVQGDHPGTKENLKYSIPKLFKEIVRDQSSFVVKTDHVLITLHKAVMESWSSLRKVEARQKRARIEN